MGFWRLATTISLKLIFALDGAAALEPLKNEDLETIFLSISAVVIMWNGKLKMRLADHIFSKKPSLL